MRVLAFDTTTAACSVAVWQDGAILASFHQTMMHGQAEALVPAIEQTLIDSDITYADLDRIAVTIGPGSFTGVRVGLATARGIGAATGCPVIGLTTTEVIATEAKRETSLPIAVAIDARRAEVYLQCFNIEGDARDEPTCLLPADAAALLKEQRWMLAGDGAPRVLKHMDETMSQVALSVPSATILAERAALEVLTGLSPRPLYVRPPDAAVPKHGGRLRP